MVTLAQLRSESASERVRRIWCGIVQFANADLAVDGHAFEDFIELLARCSHTETEADWERSEAGKRAFERELQKKLSPDELATVKDHSGLKLGIAKMVKAEEAVDATEKRIKRVLRKKLSPEELALAMDDIHHLALKVSTAKLEAGGEPNYEPSATGVDGINQEHLEPAELLSSFEELELATWDEGLTHRQALKMLAGKYHEDFTQMVTWLCAPDKQTELAPAAVQFLQKNLRQHMNLMDSPADFDKSSSGYYPVFYWRSNDYDSIMSPICEFIFDRIERYHAGELDLREAVPIQICERANCGKFLLPERIGRKRYCSGGCRARAFQTRGDWAGYMRKYRKTVKNRLTRRKRLK